MPIGVNIVGGVVSLVIYAVIVFGIYKVHQIATDLGEIKEILRDIRRSADAAAPSLPHSTENLVRAVSSASYSEVVEQPPTHSQQV